MPACGLGGCPVKASASALRKPSFACGPRAQVLKRVLRLGLLGNSEYIFSFFPVQKAMWHAFWVLTCFHLISWHSYFTNNYKIYCGCIMQVWAKVGLQ